MIKREAIETIDMALDGYRHGAENALIRLKKHQLKPAPVEVASETLCQWHQRY
jgi:hypothetical protein